MVSATNPQIPITVEWTGGGAWDWSHDGKLLIQNDYQNPVTITNYSPGYQTTPNYLNGAVKNVRGYEGNGDVTLDYRMGQTGGNGQPGRRNPPPVQLGLGDTYEIATSREVGVSQDWNPSLVASGNYPLAVAQGFIQWMQHVQVVDYNPVGMSATHFSPPALGNSAQSRGHRALYRQLPFSSVIDSNFLSYVNIDANFISSCSATPGGSPRIASAADFDQTYTDLLSIFKLYHGDIYTGWNTRQGSPGFQNPQYGTSWAGAVSQALVLLDSDLLDPPDKEALARKMIQWGLDLWGDYLDGRKNYANGGQARARKTLIIFAGHMLGISEMENCSDLWNDPNTTLPAATSYHNAPFTEDGLYWFTSWGDWADGIAGWRKDSGYGGPIGDGRWLADPVSSWGDPDTSYTKAWEFKGYFGKTPACDMGTILWMSKRGLEEAYNAAASPLCNAWSKTIPTDLSGAFASHTPNPVVLEDPAWGEDYRGEGTPGLRNLQMKAYQDHYEPFDDVEP